MSYFFAKTLNCAFDAAVERTVAALQRAGFGVLTEIDIQATLEKKLGVETPAYRILGACNPPLAYEALKAEPHVGLMLPCNVIVRAVSGGAEVAAIDPVSAMGAIDNPALGEVAGRVAAKLRGVIDEL
jgi:uncharacterized protein (DUF302 family)